MHSVAVVAIKRGTRLVPLCRAHSPEVVRIVANAALAEISAAADLEQRRDQMLASLLRQEAERIDKALTVIGVTPAASPVSGGRA